MRAGIQISIIYSDEHLLELRIWASNGMFAGQTDVYANIEAQAQLADGLHGFPTNPNDSREFKFGSFDDAYAGGGARFRFYCLGLAGHPIVEVKLRTDPQREIGASDIATFHVPIEAAAIDTFVKELELMTGVIGQVAWLMVET